MGNLADWRECLTGECPHEYESQCMTLMKHHLERLHSLMDIAQSAIYTAYREGYHDGAAAWESGDSDIDWDESNAKTFAENLKAALAGGDGEGR